jgi:hypothetical protein
MFLHIKDIQIFIHLQGNTIKVFNQLHQINRRKWHLEENINGNQVTHQGLEFIMLNKQMNIWKENHLLQKWFLHIWKTKKNKKLLQILMTAILNLSDQKTKTKWHLVENMNSKLTMFHLLDITVLKKQNKSQNQGQELQ